MNKTILCFDESNGSVAAAEYIKKLNIRDILAIIVCPKNVKCPIVLNTFSGPKEFDALPELLTDLKNTLKSIYDGSSINAELRHVFTSASNPGYEIIKIANYEHADLIVSGSRGLGKMGSLFMGSVSTYLIQNSNVPVLVVPYRK
ncbi:MAG: universal stress protein [Thermoplasmata archaeon]